MPVSLFGYVAAYKRLLLSKLVPARHAILHAIGGRWQPGQLASQARLRDQWRWQAGRGSSLDTGYSSFFLCELRASIPASSPLNDISLTVDDTGFLTVTLTHYPLSYSPAVSI